MSSFWGHCLFSGYLYFWVCHNFVVFLINLSVALVGQTKKSQLDNKVGCQHPCQDLPEASSSTNQMTPMAYLKKFKGTKSKQKANKKETDKQTDRYRSLKFFLIIWSITQLYNDICPVFLIFISLASWQFPLPMISSRYREVIKKFSLN